MSRSHYPFIQPEWVRTIAIIVGITVCVMLPVIIRVIWRRLIAKGSMRRQSRSGFWPEDAERLHREGLVSDDEAQRLQSLIEKAQATPKQTRFRLSKTPNPSIPERPPRFCPKCGYDLRATPDRCPECGTIQKKSS